MDSSPDAAVIDYTRQKEIESQVAVSHENRYISFVQPETTSEVYTKMEQEFWEAGVAITGFKHIFLRKWLVNQVSACLLTS